MIEIVSGSPPRMRGKATKTGCFHPGVRITPAYAGKRVSAAMLALTLSDHPRVCGEKNIPFLRSFRVWGSPPRMRGKGADLGRGRRALGITPAYAGKSVQVETLTPYIQDHPRICGEKNPPAWKTPTFIGSPPHMRGKVAAGSSGGRAKGITPAYAGKRNTLKGATAAVGDHPRICGEKWSL